MKLAAPLSALGLLFAMTCAGAQQVYRQVDANGKVTFSDQAASAAVGATPARRASTGGVGDPSRTGEVGGAAVAGSDNAALPFELRQVVSRYPVIIYVSEACAPCAAGRSLLMARGVPFAERSVSTAEDIDALQSLSGQKSLPLLGIGAQQLRGFSDVEWSQYLDAAGYSKSLRLPASYRNAPATPLVALRAASAAPAAAAAPTPAGAPAPTADRATGIKF